MKFFTAVFDSLFSPPFYAAAGRNTFGQALSYFFKLCLLITVVFTIGGTIYGAPVAKKAVESFLAGAFETYPQDLKITIASGKATSNVSEPFLIPVPQSMPEWFSSGKNNSPQFKNFLVVNTKEALDLDVIRKNEAFAGLFKDALAIRAKGAEIKVYSLAEFPDGEFTKSKLESILTATRGYLGYLTPIVAGVIFLVSLVATSARFFYLCIGAFLVMLLLKFKGVENWNYSQALKLSLYAITPFFLLRPLLLATAPSFDVPFLWLLMLAATIWMNIPAANPPAQAT